MSVPNDTPVAVAVKPVTPALLATALMSYTTTPALGAVTLLISILVAVPEQIVSLAGVAVITGRGSTFTVNICEVPVQPPADGVIVYSTVATLLVAFTSTSLIAPVPL